jgi:uncharacterized membrane protein
MKSYLFILFLVLFNKSISAQKTLELYNNTSNAIWATYCFYDNTNSCWTTKGWYEIEPYKTVSVSLPINSSKIYIHGQSTISSDSFWKDDITKNWGSGYSLCVDPNKAFEIRNADKVSCDNRKKFSEVLTPNNVNKFNFNP